MKSWRRLLGMVGFVAVFRPAGAVCPAFDPPGLHPGMTLSEARRVLGADEQGPEVTAVGDGFETTAYFRKPPAHIALIFPGKVSSRSKTGLAAVRTCVPLATFDGAGFAERLRDSFGPPSAGKETLDASMAGGEVTWTDPACAIDVRAWRKGDWYDPASEAWCVEQRAVRAEAAVPVQDGAEPVAVVPGASH